MQWSCQLVHTLNIVHFGSYVQKTAAITVTWQVWVLQEFGKFGAKTELVDVGTQTLSDGSVIPLPPILLGTLGNDPQKKTLLVYGHIDVQPALKV